MTPLGFRVRTTDSYWALLQQEHPEIVGRLEQIQLCLADPNLVRQSKVDAQVYLFYRAHPPYHLCVVSRRLTGDGFVITAYLTDSIKEGAPIWPTSE